MCADVKKLRLTRYCQALLIAFLLASCATTYNPGEYVSPTLASLKYSPAQL
ncbi:hypothetical protein MPB2EB_1650 [Mycoavidus sp. B2-EB]|nr:hypothetical protein MPB2EB_1650 [Mycoavidus sp. B2-EB]